MPYNRHNEQITPRITPASDFELNKKGNKNPNDKM